MKTLLLSFTTACALLAAVPYASSFEAAECPQRTPELDFKVCNQGPVQADPIKPQERIDQAFDAINGALPVLYTNSPFMSAFSNHWYGLDPAELLAYGGEQMLTTTGIPYIILPVVPNPEPKIDAYLLDPTPLWQLAPEQQAAVPLPRPNPFRAFAKQPREHDTSRFRHHHRQGASTLAATNKPFAKSNKTRTARKST